MRRALLACATIAFLASPGGADTIRLDENGIDIQQFRSLKVGEVLILSMYHSHHDILGPIAMWISHPGDTLPRRIDLAWHPVVAPGRTHLYFAQLYPVPLDADLRIAAEIAGDCAWGECDETDSKRIVEPLARIDRIWEEMLRAASDSLGISPARLRATAHGEDGYTPPNFTLIRDLNLVTGEIRDVRGAAGHPLQVYRSGRILTRDHPWGGARAWGNATFVYDPSTETSIPVSDLPPLESGEDTRCEVPLENLRARDGRAFLLRDDHLYYRGPQPRR